MRRLVFASLAATGLVITGSALATGFGGGDAPTRIPVPARVFHATVEDRSGAEVELERVTYDGAVHIHGKLGEGELAVPFERIAEVRVEPSGRTGEVTLLVRLKQGDPVRLIVKDDVPCYGTATFGNYRIDIGKIRRATFSGPHDP